MLRQKQPSKPRSRQTRKREMRNLQERKQSVMVSPYLVKVLLPSPPQRPRPRRPRGSPVKISKRPAFRFACRLEGNHTLLLSPAMPVSSHGSCGQSLPVIKCVPVPILALREVAEFLAGQSLAVDVETVSLAQHFPRLAGP